MDDDTPAGPGAPDETDTERRARLAREEQVRADARRARERAAERAATMEFVRELELGDELDD